MLLPHARLCITYCFSVITLGCPWLLKIYTPKFVADFTVILCDIWQLSKTKRSIKVTHLKYLSAKSPVLNSELATPLDDVEASPDAPPSQCDTEYESAVSECETPPRRKSSNLDDSLNDGVTSMLHSFSSDIKRNMQVRSFCCATMTINARLLYVFHAYDVTFEIYTSLCFQPTVLITVTEYVKHYINGDITILLVVIQHHLLLFGCRTSTVLVVCHAENYKVMIPSYNPNISTVAGSLFLWIT